PCPRASGTAGTAVRSQEGSFGSLGSRHWRRSGGSPSEPAGAGTRRRQRPVYATSGRFPDSTRDNRRFREVQDRLALRTFFCQVGGRVRCERKGGRVASPTSTAEPRDERAESCGAIAEAVGDLIQREPLDEDRAQGLVTAMATLSWFE